MHEGPVNPCAELPPAPAFDRVEYVRRMNNVQKRLSLYPVRVRKIKRLRKQIKDLTKALNREKEWGQHIYRRWERAEHVEWVLHDLKHDNFLRHLAWFAIGAVFSMLFLL